MTITLSANARWVRLTLLLALGGHTGCTTPAAQRYEESLARWAALRDPDPGGAAEGDEGDTSLSLQVLEEDRLVHEVLRRNPSLGASRAAWRAALAEVPLAQSLDHPMVSMSVAPLSIASAFGNDEMTFGQRIMVSQRLPVSDVLAARALAAAARADVVEADLEGARLELASLACELLLEWRSAEDALLRNAELSPVLSALRSSAEAQVESGAAPVAAPLVWVAESARNDEQRLALLARRRAVQMRLNALLHRAPDAALPPPAEVHPDKDTAWLDGDGAAPNVELETRSPELARARAQVEAARAGQDAVRLAAAPDVTLSAEYNSMFQDVGHQWMFGAALSIPLQVARLSAEREAAEARVRRARFDQLQAQDDAIADVAAARVELEAAIARTQVVEGELVPALERRADALRASWSVGTAGQGDYLEAQRALILARGQGDSARIEVARRRIQLQRALGLVPGLKLAKTGGQP